MSASSCGRKEGKKDEWLVLLVYWKIKSRSFLADALTDATLDVQFKPERKSISDKPTNFVFFSVPIIQKQDLKIAKTVIPQ